MSTEPLPKKSSRKLLFILIGGGVLGLCLCGIILAAFFPSEATPTLVTVADAGQPVAQEALTEEPTPTRTTRPTNTPGPTNTPRPTNTPTEVPSPTVPPEPIFLAGSGDDVVDVDNYFNIAIVRITGNAASRHFAVKNFGSDGSYYELLVNTTDPYQGILPLDFRADHHTTRFEVTANGEWTIEILPLSEARVLEVPGAIEGTGDEVILIAGAKPDIATITANARARHFAIRAYYGRTYDLLVNTTDPYEGRVSVHTDTVILEIRASDEWKIEMSGR